MNSVTIKDNYNHKEVSITWRADMNVQEALETAYNTEKQAGRNFDFAVQYFGDSGQEYLGYLLVMLNKTYDDPNNTTDYWLYSINGVSAQVGIDDYMVNAGDTIEFDYIPIATADTTNTIHKAKHSFYSK